MSLSNSHEGIEDSHTRPSPLTGACRTGSVVRWCAIAAAVATAGPACPAPDWEFLPRLRLEQQFQEVFDEDAHFGYATAIEDDLLVIGAPLARLPGEAWSGMCMIYRYQDPGWVLEATLYDDRLGDGMFGAAVDVDTSGDYDRVIVGAPEYDGIYYGSGAALIWYYDTDDPEPEWKIDRELAESECDTNDNYGYSVALDGNYAVVGSPYFDDFGNSAGGAWVYEYVDGSGWGAGELINGEDESWEEFGFSVDVSGDTIVVGAPENTTHWGMGESGVAYAFDAADLTVEPELVKPDYEVGPDLFGYDVAIGDSLILVGSPGDSVDGHTNIGSAFIFEYIDSDWTVVERLVADDYGTTDWYGTSVAADGQFLVVGAPKWDGTLVYFDVPDAGKVYVYNASTYNLVQGITEPWHWWNNQLGNDVATYQCRVVAGAPYDWHTNANDLGIAYVYKCLQINSRWVDLPIQPPFNSGFVSDIKAHIAGGTVTDGTVLEPVLWWRDDEAWVGTGLPHSGFGGQVNTVEAESFFDVYFEFAGGFVFDDLSNPVATIWENDGVNWKRVPLPMPPVSIASSVNGFYLPSDPPIQLIAAGHVVTDTGRYGIFWTCEGEQWQHHVLPNLQGGSMGKVNGFVIQPDPDDLVLVGQCKNADGVVRPVRWRKVGEEYQILPMPMLPEGGPAGLATSIERHADGTMTVIGRAEGSRGAQVPVQWRLMEGIWEPIPMSTDLDPPLNSLSPLGMPGCSYGLPPGPIVGFGVNAENRREGVMWAPDYAGGALGLLGTSLGDQALREAVAINADWSIAVNLVNIDDPEGPTFPAILELCGEPDPCPADFDDDGQVGTSDLLHLLACWGQPCGDLDGDDDTDTNDLLILLASWGPCP